MHFIEKGAYRYACGSAQGSQSAPSIPSKMRQNYQIFLFYVHVDLRIDLIFDRGLLGLYFLLSVYIFPYTYKKRESTLYSKINQKLDEHYQTQSHQTG